jgi:ubiquinone/menaquinone biosynthesis C-methylase UbiE
MALIEYDEQAASAFRLTRHLADAGMRSWRRPIEETLRPHPGMRVLDLGSGTGVWASALSEWFPIEVVAVEPSAAMRRRSTFEPTVEGTAEVLPLAASSMDGAWLSTVLHHFADLDRAVAELARVLKPGSPVLIRSVFPGRHEGITLFRYFPQAATVLDQYPTVGRLTEVFAGQGFEFVSLDSVPQVSADSLQAMADGMDRNAHTPLRLMSEADFEAGKQRLQQAAPSQPGPVVDHLDLLVFSKS